MDTIYYSIRKLLFGIPQIFGVTLIAFILMVYFGPDKTYDLLSKNPTAEEIASVRHELGYDRPFVIRYLQYLQEIVTFDFGNSESTGERITTIFKNTIPISIAVSLPPTILGNLLAVFLALLAGYYRGKLVDRLIMLFAVTGMSISYLIVLIGVQYIFCSSYGLNLFPVSGWSTETLLEYLKYITVPTMASVFVALGYNTRFYRAVIVEEMNKDYVRTARAYGCSSAALLFKHVLKNAMIPIITRIVFTLPFVIIAGSLLVETFFSIPGIGYVTLQAVVTGDIPIVKAVVSVTAILYVFTLILVDILYQLVDPRISLK
jgi:peptide/nickel transport system permease protein